MAKSSACTNVWYLLALFSLVVQITQGQSTVPTPLACSEGLLAIGVANLTRTFTPCAIRASETCCTGLNEVFRLGTPSTTAGCLCNRLLLEEIIREIERVPLAQAVNFTGDAITEVLQSCGTSYFGGSNSAICPPTEQDATDPTTNKVIFPIFNKGKTPPIKIQKQGIQYHHRYWLGR